MPEAWAEVLPAPHWCFEWVDAEGRRREETAVESSLPSISLATEYAAAVLAYPYWPELGLLPGQMRPAGAIFPFDARADRLILSWPGGVDAWFYREMGVAGEITSPVRRPELFDWPRFRRLLEDPVVAEAVRKDPWVVDWRAVGRKTAQSGFDRRRLVPEARTELVIPGIADGPWAGTSPFADALVKESGGEIRVKIGASVETFVSTGGILRCSPSAWIWLPFQ